MKAMTFIVKKIDRPSRVSMSPGHACLALLLDDRRGHPAAQAAEEGVWPPPIGGLSSSASQLEGRGDWQ